MLPDDLPTAAARGRHRAHRGTVPDRTAAGRPLHETATGAGARADRRRPSRGCAVAGARPLLLSLLLLPACSAPPPVPDAARVHRDFSPPAAVARLAWRPLADGGGADDFVRVGRRLYVLDRRAREVVALTPHGAGWRVEHTLAHGGEGPAELRFPEAIASGGDGVLHVLERDGLLKAFVPDSGARALRRLTLPCTPIELDVELGAGDDAWIAAVCGAGQRAADTVHVRLFHLDAADRAREVLRVPIATWDLSWGSMFTARRLLDRHGDRLVFAVGTDACVHLLPLADPGATPERVCRRFPHRFRARMPESYRNWRLPNGARFRWPDPLPPYVGLAWAATPVALQAISDDSLLASRWDATGRHTLVAPARNFVGCRGGECLWHDAGDARIALVRLDGQEAAP